MAHVKVKHRVTSGTKMVRRPAWIFDVKHDRRMLDAYHGGSFIEYYRLCLEAARYQRLPQSVVEHIEEYLAAAVARRMNDGDDRE
ncbi:hypothetical protein [Paraburkholderia unamae]|uniref:Uncharacterized protein n=1 Tax=Paraburkholderia unamae TaxID=219649 RepID=A0ACC6RGT0_9BURK